MIAAKLLGTLAILAVGTATAFRCAEGERRRLSVLDAWLELLRTLHRQIDCYQRPINEILAGCDPNLRRACGAGRDAETLCELLSAATPLLDTEVRRLLEGFAKEAGSAYREEELRHCDFYIRALGEHRDTLAKAHPMRVKLAVTLSISAALGTVILLW